MAGKFGTQMAVGAGILFVGCLLLGYMVAVEGEPGALPLALIAVGIAWLLYARARNRGGKA